MCPELILWDWNGTLLDDVDLCVDALNRLLGLGDIYAKSKVEVGLAYLKENGFDPARAVMIGDSVHDYEVAQALGVRCVLQSGGHQPPEKLRETGAPVVKGLREAAALILE